MPLDTVEEFANSISKDGERAMTDRLIIEESQGTLRFSLNRGDIVPRDYGETAFVNPLAPQDLEDLRWYLEDYLTSPFGVWQDKGPAIEAKLRPWGEALFKALFAGAAGAKAFTAAEATRNAAASYELWLSSRDPAFLGLPFELLRDPDPAADPDPLAFRLAGINRTFATDRASRKVMTSGILRVLLVIARPLGEEDAGYHAIARPLLEKRKAVAGEVAIDLLRPPTFNELKRRLHEAEAAGEPYHILHFDGHGAFVGRNSTSPGKLQQDAKGFVLFEDERGAEALVGAADLGSVLDETSVSVIVFNACRSGMIEGAIGPESTVATRLIQGGKSAVVAMAYSVYVRAAAEFMATFYETLFESKSVVEAVAVGRRRLRHASLRPSPRGDLPLADWCVPVYYGLREVRFAGLARRPERRQGLSLGTVLAEMREIKRQGGAEAAGPLIPAEALFIGRDGYLLRLERELARRPVVLVHGMAGIGKTELAKAFARWLVDTRWVEKPEHVVWYSFEPGLSSFGLDTLVDAVGGQLFGVEFHQLGGEERREAVLTSLKRHRLVLVLDNFEAVRSLPDPSGITRSLTEAEAEALGAFLAAVGAGSRSLVLVTSRHPEDWLGDYIDRFELGGLTVQETSEIVDLLLPESRTEGTITWKRRQARAFGELLELLAGHPMGLRLILPHLRMHDAATIVSGLKGEGALASELINEDNQTRSLATSVSWSLRQLEPAKLDRLLALSLFEGVIFDQWIADLCAGDGCPARFAGLQLGHWQALLDEAARLGLVSPLGLGCFRLHPSLPGLMRQRWRTVAAQGFAAEHEAAEIAFVASAAALGEFLNQQLQAGQGDLAMDLLGLLRRSLGRALSLALAVGYYMACQDIHRPLTRYFDACGLFGEEIGWKDRIISVVEEVNGGIPDFATEAGMLWLYLKLQTSNRTFKPADFAETEQFYREVAAALEQMTSDFARDRLSLCYYRLGMTAANRDRFDEAEAWYKKALAIAEELGRREPLMFILQKIGRVTHRRGYPYEAEPWYKAALAIAEELGNQPEKAFICHHLGLVTSESGRFEEAEDWYKKALAIFKALNDRMQTGMVYQRLAEMAQERGQLDEAEDGYKKVLAIAEPSKNEKGTALAYYRLGSLAQERGQLDEAEAWCKKALAIFEELSDRSWIITTYNQLEVLARGRGQEWEAKTWHQRKAHAIEQAREDGWGFKTDEQLGTLAPDQDRSEGAKGSYGSTPLDNRAPDDRPNIARHHFELGWAAYRQGQLGEAEGCYNKALAICEALGDRSGMAWSYHHLGIFAQDRGLLDEAEVWYKKALAIRETLQHQPQHQPLLATIYGRLGLLAEARGRREEVLTWMVRCVTVFPYFPHPATGPGPNHLARLTAALGLPALEAVWQQETGKPLPARTRIWIETQIRERS